MKEVQLMETKDKVKALEGLRDKLKKQYECFNPDRVSVGDLTYGVPIVHSWGEDGNLKIGKFCSIGGNVQIYLGGEHHTDWCTTYPFNALLPEIWGDIDKGMAATKGDVIIGNDVWIASDVTILSGVTIGDGAVIANGAVVTKNVDRYAIVGGVPAKHLRWRHTNCVHLDWWDWPLEVIAEVVPILCSKDDLDLERFFVRWKHE